MTRPFDGRRILLGVTGGIAAYKSAWIARLLTQAGAAVDVVLTRSAYGPAWDLEANRRRLDFARGITIASMAAQTHRDWTWLVAVDKADPLKTERKEAFRSAGVPVRFVEVSSATDSRDDAAWDAYFANWRRWIGKRDVIVAVLSHQTPRKT